MKSLVRGSRTLIKAINRNLLLNIIRREGQLSRTQLTDVSGLSVGAVSQIINDLLEKKWLIETGEIESTGGRRQTLIRLNPSAGHAVGIKLMEDRAVCAVTDFEARILYYRDYPIGGTSYPEVTSQAIATLVQQVLHTSGISSSSVLGVGIGVAGVVNPQEGIVCHSPFFGWQNFPLASLIQQQLKLPVFVENDVNTLTLSEFLFGAGRHHANFVVFTIGRGVGMGMVLGGQLYQGPRGGAGEIGHIILNLTQSRTYGVDAGTLEENASDPAVLRAVFGDNARHQRLAHAVALAESGDLHARAALASSGEYLGAGLATIINILCPPLIIISGEGVLAGAYRLNPMMDALRRYTFNGLLDGVEIVIEPTDDQAWARGAASLVIGRVFESPLTEAQAKG
jgi:N-acetylglucosamine repressor